MSSEPRPPLPPFTRETAIIKVRKAEDAWNQRDPERVSLAYTPDRDKAYPPADPFDSLLPQGIQACLAPYSILPPPTGSSFNDLGIPADTASFTLNVCAPTDAACDLVRPELF